MVDIWDYFDRWERQCGKHVPSDTASDRMHWALADSDDTRARIFGRLVISERAFLKVSERVIIVDGQPCRVEYSYYLVLDDEEVWGGSAIHLRPRDALTATA